MCTHEVDYSLLPDLRRDIHSALTNWHKSYSESPLKDLRLYQEVQRNRPDSAPAVTNHILRNGLKLLAKEESGNAELLDKLFVRGMPRQQVANAYPMSLQNLDRKSRAAREALARIIREEESLARLRFQQLIEERLEAPATTKIFGIDKSLAALSDLLTAHECPWVISLEGIGGIGKTTLANTLMRRLIQRNEFDDFGWISARQDRLYLRGRIQPVDMPALTREQLIEGLARQLLGDELLPKPFALEPALQLLRTRLKQIPHVIVIDNLETVADVEALLPTLQNLANPTKFLLTSRKSLHPDQTIYQFKVSPLAETDAFSLVRFEAHQRNSPELIIAGDDKLQEIFETVGGNPLALRLVVGQACLFDLNIVIDNLKAARGETVENLYEFIYRHSWDKLNDTAQRVFIAMPLVPERGGSFGEIVEISGVHDADVTDALSQLAMLNLVNRQRLVDKSRYSIHSLTRTFLHKHVTRWQ